MTEGLAEILEYLAGQRGIDFSGYRDSMIERRAALRLAATGCPDHVTYLRYLQSRDSELNLLLDVLTINVTRFFRDTLTFELIFDCVLPDLVSRNTRDGRQSLRIWSVGCATGEEPYSIAIQVNEMLRKEGVGIKLYLFATDVSLRSLERAREAVYILENIKNTKYKLVRRYFSQEGDRFRLASQIANLVKFSYHDILDNRNPVPPESIYGSFDLLLCRNLLMYFKPSHQEKLLDRLSRAVVPGGYLVLGQAEAPFGRSAGRFKKVAENCRIYRKA